MIIDNHSISNIYENLYTLATRQTITLPLFQRGFAWKKEQTDKILSDISILVGLPANSNKQIYLLDFIGFYESGVFKLADGQQRLVTLAILIRCIREYYEAHAITPQISNLTISYDDIDAQKKWESFNQNKLSGALKNVYLHMKEYVDANQTTLPIIEQILMHKVFVYVKIAANADDAFDIFEQINTGGKPLSKDEIISTVIKQYSNKYNIDLGVTNKELKELLTSYYKYSLNTKPGTFNNFAIMSFLDTTVIKDSKSFTTFKNYIDTTKTLSNTPELYIAKLLGRNQLVDMLYAYEVNGRSVQTNKQALQHVVIPAFLLSAIFSLAGINPAGRVKAFFDSIIEGIKQQKSDNELEQKIMTFAATNKDIATISLNTFADSLSGKSKQKVMEALFLMDILLRNTSGTFNPGSINLEHVYPQTPDVEWGRNGWPLTTDEQQTYIHSIGNYLILNSTVNKKIQNSYLDVKQPEYEKIFANDKVLQTTMNTIDYALLEHQRTQYIDSRRHQIAELIMNTFPLGQVFIKNTP